MAADADLVDCARFAEAAADLQRVYRLGDLPRLREFLAQPLGEVRARFVFATLGAARHGVRVSVQAAAPLVCQRCLQAFELSVSGGSEIEFAASEDADAADSDREPFVMRDGRVSLRELAEEELLMALPVAPTCGTPLTCGNAPSYAAGAESSDLSGGMRRPFSALQDLSKKT